jgi:hypothetical protein
MAKPIVIINRPGQGVETKVGPGWAFTANVDGHLGVFRATFDRPVSEQYAADYAFQYLTDHPDRLMDVGFEDEPGSESEPEPEKPDREPAPDDAAGA